MPQEILRRKI